MQKINLNQIFNKMQSSRYLARTGILVDIENLGKNTRCLAVKEKSSLEKIRPGVFLGKDSYSFSPGNFTNVYDLFWNPKQTDLAPGIQSSSIPYFLREQFSNNPKTIGAINGGFFFLTDQADRHPVELPYNLCIRNGQILGLPSWDHPIAFIKSGKLNAQETLARGVIKIGKLTLNWIGAKSKMLKEDASEAVLYNSKCADVTKVRDPLTNIQIGILNNKSVSTPNAKGLIDIAVGKDRHNRLIVTQINRGGGSHFFEGIFILQLKADSVCINIGDRVTPLSLDGINLQSIFAAITIGRSVDDPFFLEKKRLNRRDARSILAQDLSGFIHFYVFDGSKYIPGFSGVSAKDISTFFSPLKYKWAYFLDGGGSSRIIVKQKGKLKFLANEFAFRKLEDGSIIWDWQKARELTSSITLRIKSG